MSLRVQIYIYQKPPSAVKNKLEMLAPNRCSPHRTWIDMFFQLREQAHGNKGFHLIVWFALVQMMVVVVFRW